MEETLQSVVFRNGVGISVCAGVCRALLTEMEKCRGSQSFKMLAVPQSSERLAIKSICDSYHSVSYFSPEKQAHA